MAKQPYEPPALVYPQRAFGSESALEARAGSPLGMPEPWADPASGLPGQP